MDGWLSQFCEPKRQYMLEFLLYFCTSLWAKTKTDPWPCFKLKRINLSIGSCSEIFLCFSCIARPVCAQIESCLADFHFVTLSKCWQLACIINHAASAWISQSHLPPPSAPPPLAPLHIQPAGHSSGWPRWGDWIHVARLQREGRKKKTKMRDQPILRCFWLQSVVRDGFQEQHIESRPINISSETNSAKLLNYYVSCHCFVFCGPLVFGMFSWIWISMTISITYCEFAQLVIVYSPAVKAERMDCEEWECGIYTQHTTLYFINNA